MNVESSHNPSPGTIIEVIVSRFVPGKQVMAEKSAVLSYSSPGL